MSYSAREAYLQSTEQVNVLFSLPKQLHASYVTSYEYLLRSITDLPENYKIKVSQALKVLKNISPDNLKAKSLPEQKIINEQALVLLVSTSEYKLKEIFQLVLEKNLESFVDSQIKVPTELLRQKKFEITRDDWAKIIYSQLQEKENSNEKLYFQNIKAIKQLFHQYLGVEITLEEKDNIGIHIFFQLRHNIVHNSAIVDEQLLRNIKKVGIEFPIKEGGRYLITEEYYTRARGTIAKLFEAIDKAIQEKGLKT